MYEIGWHYDNNQVDYDRHTLDFKTISLQRASSDILGLDEIQHNMWCKSNRKYFTDATIKVTDLDSNEIAFEHSYDAKGKGFISILLQKP